MQGTVLVDKPFPDEPPLEQIYNDLLIGDVKLWLSRATCDSWRTAASDPSATIRLSYSITSSARPGSVSGIVSPSVLAVFRLRTSSTFTTYWTGRSAGLAPLRILPA